jgi:hypothetical protein
VVGVTGVVGVNPSQAPGKGMHTLLTKVPVTMVVHPGH